MYCIGCSYSLVGFFDSFRCVLADTVYKWRDNGSVDLCDNNRKRLRFLIRLPTSYLWGRGVGLRFGATGASAEPTEELAHRPSNAQ